MKSLDLIPQVKHLLGDKSGTSNLVNTSKEGNPLIKKLYDQLNDIPQLRELISKAIVDDPPLSVKEGGLIKDGYNLELDELRNVTRGGKQWIVELEAKERERTTIGSARLST